MTAHDLLESEYKHNTDSIFFFFAVKRERVFVLWFRKVPFDIETACVTDKTFDRFLALIFLSIQIFLNIFVRYNILFFSLCHVVRIFNVEKQLQLWLWLPQVTHYWNLERALSTISLNIMHRHTYTKIQTDISIQHIQFCFKVLKSNTNKANEKKNELEFKITVCFRSKNTLSWPLNPKRIFFCLDNTNNFLWFFFSSIEEFFLIEPDKDIRWVKEILYDYTLAIR